MGLVPIRLAPDPTQIGLLPRRAAQRFASVDGAAAIAPPAPPSLVRQPTELATEEAPHKRRRQGKISTARHWAARA